jgi:hypothetical protein
MKKRHDKSAKNLPLLAGFAILFAVTIFSLAGCSMDSDDDSTVTATPPALSGSVTISGFIKVGQETTANTNGLEGTGSISYQWEIADSRDMVSFTAISGAATEAYIPVEDDEGRWLRVTVIRTGYTGSISSLPIQVQEANAIVPTVNSVTISPASASVAQGGTRQFTASVTGTNSPAQIVTWTIETSGKAPETSINRDGLLTVALNETLSTLTVKAASTVDDTQYDTATVDVIAASYNLQWVLINATYNEVQSYISDQKWTIAASGSNWKLAAGDTATTIYNWCNTYLPREALFDSGFLDGSFEYLLNFQENGIGLPAGLKNSPYTTAANVPLAGVFNVPEYDMVLLFYVTRSN